MKHISRSTLFVLLFALTLSAIPPAHASSARSNADPSALILVNSSPLSVSIVAPGRSQISVGLIDLPERTILLMSAIAGLELRSSRSSKRSPISKNTHVPVDKIWTGESHIKESMYLQADQI